MNELFQEFYEAVVYGDLETAETLLSESPELIDCTDEFGFTALHGAAGEHSPEMLEFLINKGAEVNAQNDDGFTPLHLATHTETVECLLQNGADKNITDNSGRIPLDMAKLKKDTQLIKILEK